MADVAVAGRIGLHLCQREQAEALKSTTGTVTCHVTQVQRRLNFFPAVSYIKPVFCAHPILMVNRLLLYVSLSPINCAFVDTVTDAQSERATVD